MIYVLNRLKLHTRSWITYTCAVSYFCPSINVTILPVIACITQDVQVTAHSASMLIMFEIEHITNIILHDKCCNMEQSAQPFLGIHCEQWMKIIDCMYWPPDAPTKSVKSSWWMKKSYCHHSHTVRKLTALYKTTFSRGEHSHDTQIH